MRYHHNDPKDQKIDCSNVNNETPTIAVDKREEYDYKVLIDTKELHNKILDYIDSEEFEEHFSGLFFAHDKEESYKYKGAVIHGMMLASTMTSKCKPLCIRERIE